MVSSKGGLDTKDPAPSAPLLPVESPPATAIISASQMIKGSRKCEKNGAERAAAAGGEPARACDKG